MLNTFAATVCCVSVAFQHIEIFVVLFKCSFFCSPDSWHFWEVLICLTINVQSDIDFCFLCASLTQGSN